MKDISYSLCESVSVRDFLSFYNKYNNSIRVTAIFDKAMISPYKASPIDQGPQVFEKLLAERIIPKG